MNKIAFVLFVGSLALSSCRPVNAQSEAEANAPDGMILVWHDEFDVDGPLDDRDWGYEEGFVRNRELQWYQKENAICRDGCLVIEGRRERKENPYLKRYREREARNAGDRRDSLQRRGRRGNTRRTEDWRMREFADYTSSSVITRGKHEFLFGRFEVRARIPVASGSWPAIWTLGTGKPWVECGEIDIMEYYRIKGVPTILANVAWAAEKGEAWDTQRIPFSRFLEKDPQWADKFHTWRMDWDSTAIRLYLDDELLNETLLKDTWNQRGERENPFLKPQYLLLNLALGSSGGDPDTTAFPMRYLIDWVRVYQTPEQRTAQWGEENTFNPGRIWPDSEGRPINAHGGGILKSGDTYYWFGEHKGSGSTNAFVGVTCYSSTDLYHWKYEGVALPVSDDPDSPLASGCIMERPKVVYNAATGKYVMWFHLELKGKGYDAALAAVATADRPQGTYTFLKAERPNAGRFSSELPADEWEELKNELSGLKPDQVDSKAIRKGYFALRDLEGGQMSRDQTVFVDDDGKAYRIFSAEENYTLNIAELSDDYQSHTGKWMRMMPGGHNEAPAIFKKEGLYWIITSGCTGWEPNEARMFSASSIWGPWKQHSNPCKGEGAEKTFDTQSTFVLPVTTDAGTTYIFMADLWKPREPGDSRYVWLPLSFDEKGVPELRWQSVWRLP